MKKERKKERNKQTNKQKKKLRKFKINIKNHMGKENRRKK